MGRYDVKMFVLNNGDVLLYSIDGPDKDNNKYININGYLGDATTLNIPSSIDDLPVKKILSNAFENNKTIVDYIFPNTLEVIEKEAFCNSQIQNLILSAPLKSIGKYAFDRCYYLKNVSIDLDGNDKNESLTIGDHAFSYCHNLTSAKFSKGIVFKDSSTFAGCISLESVILPSDIKIIPSVCFENCGNLKSIYLPPSLKLICQYAFRDCTSLEYINISKTNVHTIEHQAFLNCENLSFIAFPDSLTHIEKAAFHNVDVQKLKVKCKKDSYAEKWAKDEGYLLAEPKIDKFLNLISDTKDEKTP